MPLDMKQLIAEAVRKLIFVKKVQRLTVKDIVEECQITRQAFYYHFENIPQMMKWILEKEGNKLIASNSFPEDPEKGIKEFFILSANALPRLAEKMPSSYREEIEELISDEIYQLFCGIAERNGLLRAYSREDAEFFIRYHSQAVVGILRTWSEADMENIDRVVHNTYLLVTGEIKL